MTAVIFREADNLIGVGRRLSAWARARVRRWEQIKADHAQPLYAQTIAVIFREADNLVGIGRRLAAWARACVRRWEQIKADHARPLYAQMTAVISRAVDNLRGVSRQIAVWMRDRASRRQIQSAHLVRIVGAAAVAIAAGSMTYRGLIDKPPRAVPRQVTNNTLRGDRLPGLPAFSGITLALVARNPLPPTRPALPAAQQPLPSTQLAMALPQAALPLPQSLPQQQPEAATAALELAKLEEGAPAEDRSAPAPAQRDLSHYLRLYPYAEYQMPDRPADLVLASMKDIPIGTPIEEIERASGAFGLNFSFMKAVARIESDFDPGQRTGSYMGLFQLSRYEFRKYGSGDIFNARDNAVAAAYKFVTEETLFEWYTGKNPTFSDLYLIHQQGWQGAAEHVSRPERIAWQSMCATDEGIEKGEKWCKRAVWGNTLPSVKQIWKSVDNLTSGAFVDMWRERVDELFARYAQAAAEGKEIPVKKAEGPTNKQRTVHAKARAKAAKAHGHARRLASASAGARKVAALDTRHAPAGHAKNKHADVKRAVKKPEHHRRAAAPPPSHHVVPIKKSAQLLSPNAGAICSRPPPVAMQTDA